MTPLDHNPLLTTTTELIEHVKSHLVPELALDHLTDYDVRCLIGLTMHSLTHFGLTLVPASSGQTAAVSIPLEVGRIEPTVPVAAELLAGACWRVVLRRLGNLAEWLDARFDGAA